jgi:anti-sigma-K factor RskA
MNDREPMHPNLADALEADADDAAELDAIARRLGGAAPIEEVPPAPADLAARVRAALEAADHAEPTAEDQPAEDQPGVVVDLSARRRSRWLPAVAVAAAAAVVAVVVGVTITDDGDDVERQEVELASLPGFGGSEGTATLEVDDGDRRLAVHLSGVDVPSGSHLELWLLDPTVTDLVALGEITGDGPHELPPDVDLGHTPIVDVSLEPDDGDPSHSGVSVLRGEVPPA